MLRLLKRAESSVDPFAAVTLVSRKRNIALPRPCRILKVCVEGRMKFSELVRLLKRNGFTKIREKGSIRYYAKGGVEKLIRVDYHGAKEVPTGTCHAILKAAGLKKRGRR